MVSQDKISIVDREDFAERLAGPFTAEIATIVNISDRPGIDTNFVVCDYNHRTSRNIEFINFLLSWAPSGIFVENECRMSFVLQGNDCPFDLKSVSWQKKKQYQNVCLLPDFYYTENKGYHEFLPESPVSWNSRKNAVVWRGSTTGGGLISEATLPNLPRYRLCKIGQTFDDRADMGIYTVVQSASEDERVKVSGILEAEGVLKNFIPMEEYANYKFLMQIDGNGNSWELLKKLRLGCCLILVDSDWLLWHNSEIRPWKHYVPVRNDLSNLADVLKWCFGHDDEVAEIARNGRNYALGVDFEQEMRSANVTLSRYLAEQ